MEIEIRTLTHWLMSPQAAEAKEAAKNAAFEKAEARRRVRLISFRRAVDP